MSFRITLGTHQDAGTPFFRVQQQPAVWTFGTASWSASNGERTLTMNQSGTSGILRFVNNNGERFAVIVGIDNRQRWCDIIPDDSPAQTSLSLLSRYYTRGPQATIRESRLSRRTVVTSRGRRISIHFNVPNGNNLRAGIVIA